MYTMELKENEKVFLITMSGLMTEEESRSYIDEFKKKIKTMNTHKYNIVVDAKELKTSPQELTGLMEQAMDLITNTPFKTRYSVMPKSAVATSQVKRVARKETEFDDTIFAESFEEVLRML